MLEAFREILERNTIALLFACLALSIPLSGCGSRPPGTLAVYDSTAGAAKAETFVLGAQAEVSRACLISQDLPTRNLPRDQQLQQSLGRSVPVHVRRPELYKHWLH